MRNRHASIIGAVGMLGLALCGLPGDGKGQATGPESDNDGTFQWVPFPDESRFKLLGLHWYRENRPKLWRMPESRYNELPNGVKNRCKAPSGGRILIKCNTTSLGLRIRQLSAGGQKGFDVYINDRFFKSVIAESGMVRELVLFAGLDRDRKEILIYLPYHQEVVIESVGVDPDTTFEPPEHKYARPLPVVFYGSSVCQGSGASRPGMTYPAIVCRELDLDFINLGFGGAGKAERSVVDLVASIPACCYVFDLGKSYGMQDKSAYKQMLQTVRTRHPGVPIVCITPITSSREVRDAEYSRRSIHTRTVMREAVNELADSGEKRIYLVEGTDLLGFDEHEGLSKDGVHPSDHGFSTIARKLLAVLKKPMGL